MDKRVKSAVCYIEVQRVTEEDFPDYVNKLLKFEGWSIIADQETYVEPDSDPSVYFKGDQGRLQFADVSDIEKFLDDEGYDRTIDVDVPLYYSEQSERHNTSVSSEIFIRDVGKEESFWFPSPTYLFDTETSELLKANSIDFDVDNFIDGVIITEEDVSHEKVVLIENVRTGASQLFDKEYVESSLGDRFHAVKPVL